MQKKEFDPNFFEIPFRPPYELRAAGMWLLGAAATVLALRSPFPHFPFRIAAGLCLVMAVARMIEGYPYWKQLRALRKHEPIYTDLEHLRKMMQREKKVESFYIGEGYKIDTAASERTYEMVRRGPESMLPDAVTNGCNWLQHVKRPEPQFIPLKFLEGQTLLVGTTGAGKTVSFRTFLTQAVVRGDAVVVIDPKGDRGLLEGAREACNELGQPERFLLFNPADPQNSVRINPLANWNRSTEPASRLAALIPSETGADPFSAFGWNCLNAICLALIYLSKKPDLLDCVRYIEASPEDLVKNMMAKYFLEKKKFLPENYEAKIAELRKQRNKEGEATAMADFYRTYLAKDHQLRALESILSVYEHNREHFGKMVASLIPVLNMLTTSPLDQLLSPRASSEAGGARITNFAEAINNGDVVYCALDSLSDKTIGSALGSMFLADLTAVAGDRYNNSVNLTRRVWIFIDEAAEVLNDPCIQILNKGRGANFHVMMATQTLADFEARTGSAAKARQVLGNVNNTFCMRVKDGETRDYIAEKLPKAFVRFFQRSFTAGTGSSDLEHYRGSYSENINQEEVSIVPPNLLESLPNWEYVATFADGRVIKGLMPITRIKPKSGRAAEPTAQPQVQPGPHSIDDPEMDALDAARRLEAAGSEEGEPAAEEEA